MSIYIKGLEMPDDGMLCINIFPDGRVAGHYDCTIKQAKAISADDVRPVVRGKWVVSRTDYGWNGVEFPTHCKCTECGREVPYLDKDNFCPKCGAIMGAER